MPVQDERTKSNSGNKICSFVAVDEINIEIRGTTIF